MASAKVVFPKIIVNLKTYPETLGAKAAKLAKAAMAVEKATGVSIAIAPQAVDLRLCVDTGARVYAQHFDRLLKPESTGWQSIGSLKDAGCAGTLINHSEHRIPLDQAAWFVQAAREAGLVSVLCSKDSIESGRLSASQPDLVAVEPPELIGGEISVTTANPDVVRRSVTAVRNVSPRVLVLCGAGVKNAADVARAVELGAHGILVASGVTRAKDPAKALRDLASGFAKA